MSKTFPSIPDPIQTTDSMLETIRALKQSVELLTGQRGAVSPARTFIQSSNPTPVQAGDLWIKTDASNKVLVWSGSTWLSVTV